MTKFFIFVTKLYYNLNFEKMMNDWYDSFLEALYKKYPKKSQLTEALMDLLFIEKESVYRRLRKDIMFSVHELAKIAAAWHISLDEIIGVNSYQIPFKVQLSNYLNPPEKQVKYIHNIIKICNSPGMKYMEVSNKLPRSLTSGFPYIARYQLLKWMNQFVKEDDRLLPYSKVFFPIKIAGLVTEYHKAVKNVASTTYIWDSKVFDFLIYNVRYFHSIYLITDEEKELIKNDLYDFLNYMSEVATRGCWLETGNKVNLYISSVSIDTNYNYYASDEFKLCRIHAFAKSEISTNSPEITEDFINWLELEKRSAVLISGANEKSRIEFFVKQHELIDTL